MRERLFFPAACQHSSQLLSMQHPQPLPPGWLLPAEAQPLVNLFLTKFPFSLHQSLDLSALVHSLKKKSLLVRAGKEDLDLGDRPWFFWV